MRFNKFATDKSAVLLVPKVLASAKLPTGDRSDCGFKPADRRC